jgi:hypothetical protein
MEGADAMIQYTSNVSQVVRLAVKKVEGLASDQLLRTVAFAVLPELKKRVHIDGKASDGSQIGTYSPSYMALRTGNYQNADKHKKGKNKGKNKNAGTFTDRTIRLNKQTGTFTGEDKVGKARPNYHRSNDTKVILSLTRQMENDLSVIPVGQGYGIGYSNKFNFQKSQWNESTYRKRIWALTQGEKDLAKKVAEDFVTTTLNQ